MTEARIHVKVPIDRVGVLIGPNGHIRKKIERLLQVKLKIDSSTGDIEVQLEPNTQDPAVIFRAKNIITAIGRGFTPDKAFKLADMNVLFEVIDLREYFGKSSAGIRRIKGRIIGSGGKTRRLIEELTGANLSVYGHTVSIIGDPLPFNAAREAVHMLINGSEHRTVYRFLQRKRGELKKEKLKLWEEPEI